MCQALRALVVLALVPLTACSSSSSGSSGAQLFGSSPAARSSAPTTPSPPAGRTPAPTTPASSASPAPEAAFTDPAAVRALLAAAGSDLVATNTYDYRHLAQYRRVALAATTGSLTTLIGRTLSVIAGNAPALHARQTAKVLRLGLATLDGSDATILAFGRLTVQNKTYPHGRTDPFTVTAGVHQVGPRWLLSRLTVDGVARCAPPGTPGLVAACAAAGTGAAAITTFRRARFEQDFAHALSLLTDPLRSQFASKKALTLQAMRKGGFDLRGEVVASAVESATANRVVVLVALNGSQSKNTTPVAQRLAVTVEDVNGSWLLSDVQDVGVS